MTDWVKQSINAAKERREQRKLEFEHALETRRPIFWNALIERIGNAVSEFNEGITLAKPIQVTKKTDTLVYVIKENMPPYNISIEYQESQNLVLYTIDPLGRSSESERKGTESFIFDVDEDGHVWLSLYKHRLDVDESAKCMLIPVFDMIA